VEGVEEELVAEGDAAFPRLEARVRDTHVNLARERAVAGIGIDRECEDVGGAFNAEELLVKVGYFSVAHEDHVEGAQGGVDQRAGAAKISAEVGAMGGGDGGADGDGEFEGGAGLA
jgi:hypothetical protein